MFLEDYIYIKYIFTVLPDKTDKLAKQANIFAWKVCMCYLFHEKIIIFWVN